VLPSRDGQNPESESDWSWIMALFVGFGVESEYIFVTLLESEFLSNFKIKTKKDAIVKCDFDVTTLVFQTLKSSESEWSMILEKPSAQNPGEGRDACPPIFSPGGTLMLLPLPTFA